MKKSIPKDVINKATSCDYSWSQNMENMYTGPREGPEKNVNQGPSDAQISRILILMKRLIQARERYSKELLKTYQISVPQLNGLVALHENGAMPPSSLAKFIMVNSSTVTGIIDRLEQKGLVQRARVSADRRIVTITLTDSGRMIAQNAPPPIHRKIADGLKMLPSAEREKIQQALSKLSIS